MALVTSPEKIRVPIFPAGFPHPVQHEFLYDTHRFGWALGGIQSGKSQAGAVKSGTMALRAGEKSTGLVIAPTYGILRTATMFRFLQAWEPVVSSVNHSTFEARLGWGQTIYFRSATEPDNFRGITADWLWGDEVSYWSREAYQVALGRLAATGGPVIFTTTPNGYNFVYDIYSDTSARRADHAFFRFSSFDNPGADQEYLAVLESNMSPDMARQELYADFLAPGQGRVYADFRREIHVNERAEYDPKLPVYVGLDFGYRNPAALFEQVDATGLERQYDEYVERNIGTEHLGRTILERTADKQLECIYCDPAGDAQNPQTLMSEVFTLRQMGLPVRFTTRPRDRSKEAGEDRVRARLMRKDGTPAYLVHPRCVKTIAAHEGYMFDKDQDGKSPGRVGRKDGVHDHAMDARRYLVVNLFPVAPPSRMSATIPFVRL